MLGGIPPLDWVSMAWYSCMMPDVSGFPEPLKVHRSKTKDFPGEPPLFKKKISQTVVKMLLFKKCKYIFFKSLNYSCLLDYSSVDRFLTRASGGAVL